VGAFFVCVFAAFELPESFVEHCDDMYSCTKLERMQPQIFDVHRHFLNFYNKYILNN
jgi:hypothetical protein